MGREDFIQQRFIESLSICYEHKRTQVPENSLRVCYVWFCLVTGISNSLNVRQSCWIVNKHVALSCTACPPTYLLLPQRHTARCITVYHIHMLGWLLYGHGWVACNLQSYPHAIYAVKHKAITRSHLSTFAPPQPAGPVAARILSLEGRCVFNERGD